MNFGDFKAYVAAFLQRSEASFTSGSVEVLDTAVNQARMLLERKKDFEMARTECDITLNTDGSKTALTSAKLKGTATACNVKTIKKAFIASVDDTWLPIDCISRDVHISAVRRQLGVASALTVDDISQIELSEGYALVRFGLYVYLVPAGSANYQGSSTVTVRLDAIRWLNAYSLDADTDFLLTYCPDLMLMQTIKFLNFSMREDARIPVSMEAYNEAWKAMEDWNRSIAMSDDDGRRD